MLVQKVVNPPEGALFGRAERDTCRGSCVRMDRCQRKIDENPANLSPSDIERIEYGKGLDSETPAIRALEVRHLVDCDRGLLRALRARGQRNRIGALGGE